MYMVLESHSRYGKLYVLSILQFAVKGTARKLQV